MFLKLEKNWKFTYKNNYFDAIVPGTIHTDLLNNKIIEEPYYSDNESKYQWIDKQDWIYELNFDVPKEMFNDEKIFLVFDGVDTFSEIKLNGTLIFETKNMFVNYEKDIKSLLKTENNKLDIHFFSPINEGVKRVKELGFSLPAINDTSKIGGLLDEKVSIHLRKAPYHFGWDWGPRFVTSGIFKDVYLKSFNNAKIIDVYYHQKTINEFEAEIDIYLEIESFFEQKLNYNLTVDGNIYLNENINLKDGLNKLKFSINIDKPNLWWPNRLGTQYLYKFVSKLQNGEKDTKKIGLRTIELVREKDNFGESFLFRVNGHEVFMKGANHIPNDNFIPRINFERYEREIVSSKKSNLNMIRVWGGGYYESEDFYDLCDQHGILVWQDFMYACSMYPWDQDFIENISDETEFNIKKLRSRTCLALFCGNNEIDSAWNTYYGHGWGWKAKYTEDQKEKITYGYNKIFYDVLPNLVNKLDFNTNYWASSPWSGDEKIHSTYDLGCGDIHFWGVWHNNLPFSDYGKYIGRFVSEYGVQSFPDIETLETISPKEDMFLLSKTMLAHQKAGVGNEIIKHYLNEYFEETEDFERIVHLSQLSQGEAMRMAIELHRTSKPYCMGSLYWQLNDTWPGASWSSIDYFGKWKASQFLIKEAAKDVILCIKEKANLLQVFAVSDILKNKHVKFKLEVKNLENKVVKKIEFNYKVMANVSKFIQTFSREELIGNENPLELYVVFSLVGDDINYERIFFFEKIYKVNLKKPNIKIDLFANDETSVTLKICANEFTKYFGLKTNKIGYFDKNFFDLEKDKEYEIIFETNENVDVSDFTFLTYN